MYIPLIIVTGPVGVGKTSVASEMSEILEQRHIPHAAVDMDVLSWCFPRPHGDRFGSIIAFRNLSAVWQNFQQFGADRLIIPVVIEARSDLDRYRDAVPGADIVVVRLRASVSTLRERVASRELGSGLEWHLGRAAELAEQFERQPVEDFCVETESRSVRDIAWDVLRRVGWIADEAHAG